MSRNFTGLLGITLLLLATVSSAIAGHCDCDHREAGVASLSPISCCGPTPHTCCLETSREISAFEQLLAEAPTSPRLPGPAITELNSASLPVVVAPVKVVRAPRAERPPGGLCADLSFRQTWLI